MDKKARIRLIVTLLVIVVFIIIGRIPGASEYLSRDNVQTMMESLGWMGVFFFLLAFSIGELIYLPGILFVIAAVLAYGLVPGGLLAYVGSILSVTVSFVIVRTIGGKPLTQIKWKFFQRMMQGLEKRPILTVAILRVPLFLAPPLNYALALSPIQLRHYFIGSLIGLYFPVAGTALLVEYAPHMLPNM